MSGAHWGEIPKQPVSNFFMPDVTADIERSMDKFCLAEYTEDSEILKTEHLSLPPMDPLMLYSISLHKYINDMIEMIRVAELATETNLIPPEDAAPPMPLPPEINVKHTRNSLNYMPKDATPFASDWEADVPELSETIVKKVLTKCVATMFAHVGFETTHQSVLDVINDVLETFYQKFCHKLVDAIEDEEKENCTGFPHVVEKILTETGMGGVKGLNDYYQNRIVKYISVLQKRCRDLNDHYALLIPKSVSPDDKFNKVEKMEDDEDVKPILNSEIHFTSFDGEMALLENESALVCLQGLGDITEEDNTITSPGVVSIPSEADMPSLSRFAKKKRFK